MSDLNSQGQLTVALRPTLRQGELRREACMLMSKLLLDEGAQVTIREQAMQRAVMAKAGAGFVSHLHTSKWSRSFDNPHQLHAVARVSAMAAFQHLFELHARVTSHLLKHRPNPQEMRSLVGEKAEPWRKAMLLLKPWLEQNSRRLFSSTAQLFLHSMLASAVQGKPEMHKDPGTAHMHPAAPCLVRFRPTGSSGMLVRDGILTARLHAGHDSHAFLLHVIKICSNRGADAFYRRLTHPTGVAWLWDGYFARMQVYRVRPDPMLAFAAWAVMYDFCFRGRIPPTSPRNHWPSFLPLHVKA